MAASAYVRLPSPLSSAARAAAEAAGLSVSAWLRLLAVDAVSGMPADARPSPPRHSLPRADVIAVAALRESTAEAAGALTKSAAFNRRMGDPLAIANELEALIPKFKSVTLELDELKARLLA